VQIANSFRKLIALAKKTSVHEAFVGEFSGPLLFATHGSHFQFSKPKPKPEPFSRPLFTCGFQPQQSKHIEHRLPALNKQLLLQVMLLQLSMLRLPEG